MNYTTFVIVKDSKTFRIALKNIKLSLKPTFLNFPIQFEFSGVNLPKKVF